MKNSRIVALLLAILIVAVPIFSVAESVYPLAGSPTLTYWMPLNAGVAKYIKSYDENYAYAKMQEITGVDIEWIHPAAGQETEQFNLMMASRDKPDLIAMANKYDGGEYQGVRDGVFLDLTDLIEKYAPNYWNLLQTHEDFRRTAVDKDGMIAAFCTYKEPGDPPASRLIIHESTMQAIGETVPETIADWDRIFEKIYATGVIPYLLAANGVEPIFVGAYDTYPGFYVNLEGKIEYGYITEGFRQYLTQMHEWYEKGYITKDFTSLDSNTRRTKFDSGEIAVLADAIVATFNRAVKAGNPIISTPYTTVERGATLHWIDADVEPRWINNENTTAISAKCENVEAALRFLDFAYSEEGIELLNWGVEGVNWDWVDGQRVYNDLMLKNELYTTENASYIYKVHFATKYTQRATYCHANLLASPASLAIRFQYNDNYDYAFYLSSFITYDEDDAVRRAELMADINTYVNEMVLKFITGVEPMSNFDKYVQTVRSMNIDEVLDIITKGYTEYMSK